MLIIDYMNKQMDTEMNNETMYVISANNEFCIVVDKAAETDTVVYTEAEVYEIINKDADIARGKRQFLSDRIFKKENNIKTYLNNKIAEGRKNGKNFVTLNKEITEFFKLGYKINTRIYKISNFAENCTRDGNKLFFELT